MATAGRMQPRTASLEPHLAALLPELLMTVTPEQLALIAARAMVPKQAPTVGLAHLHAPAVSVREQAVIIGDRLRRERVASFRSLVADADSTLVVVARFLALLELFRESAIGFEQAEALGELTVRWTGPEDGDIEVDDEFDEPPPPETGADDPRRRTSDPHPRRAPMSDQPEPDVEDRRARSRSSSRSTSPTSRAASTARSRRCSWSSTSR